MLDINKVKPVPETARKFAAYLREQADPNTHGGCYVNADTGTLHVNLIEGRENALDVGPADGIVFHIVKYSYADLEKAKENILENDNGKAVSGLAIDTMTNRIRVIIEASKMRKLAIPTNAVSGMDMLAFESVDEPVRLLSGNAESYFAGEQAGKTSADSVRTLNGAKFYPLGYGAPSLAAGIVFGPSNNRKFGWLTTTHGDALNANAYYSPGYISDVLIGKVAYTNFSDNRCDFSIIERTNASIGATDYTTTGVVTNLFGGLPEQGDALYQCGYASGGRWGKCLSNNLTVNVSGNMKYEYIQTDIPAAGGDSGGPILWKLNSTQNSLVSLMSGTNGVWTAGGRANTYRDLYNFDICQF